MPLPQAQVENVSVFGKGVASSLAGREKMLFFYYAKGHAGMAGDQRGEFQ